MTSNPQQNVYTSPYTNWPGQGAIPSHLGGKGDSLPLKHRWIGSGNYLSMVFSLATSRQYLLVLEIELRKKLLTFIRAYADFVHLNFSIFPHHQVLKAQTQAKKKGFSDVIFLDSVNKRNLEEVSSCNIFLVKVSIISLVECSYEFYLLYPCMNLY